MNQKPISRKWIFLLILAVLTASACNLFSNLFNPIDDVVSEIEDIAEQVDIENIEELGENIGTMVPEIPTDLGDIQATIEAVQEGFDLGEAPPDIPIVDGETENFFASEAFISYTTPMDFDDVMTFYQEEMPNNNWEPNDDGSLNMAGTALLQFSKSDRIAIVTITENQEDETTTVLITLQPE